MTRSDSSSLTSILSCPPVLAKGALNHSSKDLTEPKILGRTKLRRAQSSGRLFCGKKAQVRGVRAVEARANVPGEAFQ